MRHHKIANGRIENIVLEGQRFGLSHAELHRGMQPTGQLDHRRSHIHSHHGRAQSGSLRGRIPGPSRQIEDPRALLHPGGIQQRANELTSDPADHIVIRRRLMFPAGPLERGECVGVRAEVGLVGNGPVTCHSSALHAR
jgi:hypothetical protein